MKVAVITNEELKKEWLSQGIQEEVMIDWLTELAAIEGAGCYIDLMFDDDDERINKLKKLSAVSDGQPALVIVNSVNASLKDLPENFIRINGWPTFLKRTVVEAACRREELKTKAEIIFKAFNRSAEWVPDVPGFISARIISMIINEAYFALDEKVSSKDEIDTAMKLGTNYPYGPFEWSEKIGLKKVHELLTTLSNINSRYEPAPLLKKEASLS